MDKETRKIIVSEGWEFALYCVVTIVSIHSSTSRTGVEGGVHTRFFPDLFVLHLFAWLIVYVIIRSIVWSVKVSRKK